MRRYETIVIMDPDLSDDERSPVFQRLEDLISKEKGLLVEIDNWGTKKLAYEIRKKKRGFYSRIDYCGTGTLVDEIERFFRIDDRVIKYMTVVLDKFADIESIKEDMARAIEEEEIARAKAEEKEAETAAGQSENQPDENQNSEELDADRKPSDVSESENPEADKTEEKEA